MSVVFPGPASLLLRRRVRGGFSPHFPFQPARSSLWAPTALTAYRNGAGCQGVVGIRSSHTRNRDSGVSERVAITAPVWVLAATMAHAPAGCDSGGGRPAWNGRGMPVIWPQATDHDVTGRRTCVIPARDRRRWPGPALAVLAMAICSV